MGLKEYKKKRKFSKTPEPESESKSKKSKKPIFVVQKHDASNLHYDFRIEMDGVLKSWAVPKKPSKDPAVKRLAIPTEDHPLEYADFEGEIPEGEYGAGTVEIWDKGTYKKLEGSMNSGKLVLDLKGKKLKGKYSLVNFKKKHKELWLLIKMKD